jgi:hypothetical protein
MDPSWPFSQGQWCWLMWTLGRGFTGWWLTYPSEKYESIMKVNGKDDIPYYIMENDPNVWNHQPAKNNPFCPGKNSLTGPASRTHAGGRSAHQQRAN